MNPARLFVIFSSELSQVPHVGAHVRAFVQESLGAEGAGEVELCVVEAINNAIEHACGSRSGLLISVIARRTAEEISIEVSDQGEPMAAVILERAPPLAPNFDPTDLDALPERGFGLSIMKQVMDEISYDTKNGRNTLTLVRRIPNDSPEVSRP